MGAVEEAYQRGLKEGYRVGDMERIALATANSDLRSDNLKLSQKNQALQDAADKCWCYAP